MQAIKDLLPGILANLQAPEKQTRGKLVDEWPALVGAKIAAHTKPAFRKNGELCIWVDQAPLAYELSQKYGQVLLGRAQACLGKETVKSLKFYVGQIRL